jgi:hypothetical protein
MSNCALGADASPRDFEPRRSRRGTRGGEFGEDIGDRQRLVVPIRRQAQVAGLLVVRQQTIQLDAPVQQAPALALQVNHAATARQRLPVFEVIAGFDPIAQVERVDGLPAQFQRDDRLADTADIHQ